MKKNIILFFFLFCTAISFCNIKIASFNTLKLNDNRKDFQTIAKILHEYDLIGLEEVMSEKGIQLLTNSLNRYTHQQWTYHISEKPTGTKKYKEYFGYVWNRKVKFVKSEGFYQDDKNEFIRDAYGATFKADEFDFTFILNHAIFGKRKALRKAEASNLYKVYDYFQQKDIIENDIILAGDFNLESHHPSFSSLYQHKDNVIPAIDSMNYKTTINYSKYCNSYDNIFVSKKYTKEYFGVSGVYQIQDFLKYRKTISDHVPVYIEVMTEFDDD